ncbi:MAG: CDP-glucose 4,6-dehydratase [Desulfurivibrionaceae bacterium]
MEDVEMTSGFWQGKKVLITGHTGFKGSWLSLWLQQLGAHVIGVSLDPPTIPNLFQQARIGEDMVSLHADIRDGQALKKIFHDYQPEILFHLAAQPLVRYSYREPVETYETNVMGTMHVLEAIRSVGIGTIRAAVMVTTDKCYENREWDWGYRENEAMGGYDPYSSSKGAAELLIASYRNSFFSPASYNDHMTAVASARAGNVIGGGDWAEDRLIPDILRAFQKDETVHIRTPHAIRPWQHVLEPLSGYLNLAERLYTDGVEFAEPWNFGPLEEDAKPVKWIVEQMANLWGENATWQIDVGDYPHEAHYLKLDCSKAHARLGWWPKWPLETALGKIIDWHQSHMHKTDSRQSCLQQIDEYTKLMRKE